MAYTQDELPSGLDALTTLADGDILVASDITDSNRVKGITYDNLAIEIAADTLTFTNKTFDVDGTGNTLSNVANSNIKASAAIAVNKLAALTASEIVITDASGFIASGAVSTYPSLTELAYVKGVTSAIQTQIDAKGVGDLLANGTVPLTANWDVGAFTITGTQFISDIATGTAPFVVSSTTEVANLKSATVTTNANLTGIVTSTGNATAIANKAIAIAKLADGTDGELITWGTAGVIETIAVGTANQVLTSNGAGAAPTFQAATGSSPLTTKGDVYTYDTSDARLGVGANGTVLTADSAQATGLKWATPAGGGDVSKVGTPADNQVGVWTGDGTIEGTSGLTYDGANLLLTGDIGATATRITKGWFTDLQVTNSIAGSITGNATTVTNATLSTALTVDTGTVGLTGDVGGSVLTLGSGASSISGSNTGDQTTITGNAGSATVLQTARTIGGTSFDGSANIVPATITVADTVDATSFVGLWESATGDLAPKTDLGLTYNAGTAALTATTFIGALTGQASTVATIAGLAPDTATTQATQAAITSAANLTTVGTLTSGNATAIVDAATSTAAGKAELAIASEINTGTDTTRIMPIDQFVASNRNIKYFTVILVASDASVATGTTIGGDFRVPFAGTLLQSDTNKYLLSAYNSTAGITGTMVVDIHLNGTTVMTTNKLDIETTEKTTADATTQPDLTTTAVAEGDILTFDVDAIHSGTAALGLKITFAIRQT